MSWQVKKATNLRLLLLVDLDIKAQFPHFLTPCPAAVRILGVSLRTELAPDSQSPHSTRLSPQSCSAGCHCPWSTHSLGRKRNSRDEVTESHIRLFYLENQSNICVCFNILRQDEFDHLVFYPASGVCAELVLITSLMNLTQSKFIPTYISNIHTISRSPCADVLTEMWDSTPVWYRFSVRGISAGEGCTPTWCEEAVEVTDDGAKSGPECGLIVHAAGNQIGQFGPLWCGKLVVVLIEQGFLEDQI